MNTNLSLAKNLIHDCKTHQRTTLDLSYCGITDLNDLPELFDCTQLEVLVLCEAWQNSEDSQILGKNVQNGFAENSFTSLPNSFSRLQNLKKLICNHENGAERKIENVQILGKLLSLEHLVLNSAKVKDISFVSKLIKLKWLNVGNNEISDASAITVCENLTTLDVGANRISDFSFLKNLRKLKLLYLYGLELNNCNFLSTLITLRRLNLYNNHISDCSPLQDLTHLNSLFLERNAIRSLPLFLFQRGMATTIETRRKRGLSIGQNPIESPPIEILRQGTQSVLDWFEANREKLNEIKVILIGDPKAGKTSLLRRLKNDTFSDNEPQTDGINIEHIQFGTCTSFKNHHSLHTLTGHFWDFGGQEIMNATHQFFLTNRSVYVLVVDARKDQKVAEHIRTWVKRIKATGGNSPIIIVANQADVNPGFGFSNEIDLQNEFPQIKCFIKVSCRTGDGIAQIKQKLEDLIPTAELFNTEIDERWIRIMKQLQEETKSKHYLDETRFNKICDDNNLQKSSRKNAINFLNDLGLVLHFDSLDLAEYYVLDPYWITFGVYQIVTSAYAGAQKGIVPMEKLEFIVNEEEDKKQIYQPAEYRKIIYDSTNQRRFLVDILNQFKLCFYLPGNSHFIIPDLLDTTEPVVSTRPIREDADAISFVYEYEYLSNSVMPRIMVEAHWLLTEKWRTGCILEHRDSKALISSYQNRITITVIGTHKKKREFMAIVRSLVDEINKDLPDKPKMLIPLDGINSYAEYDVLLAMERKGRKEYVYNEFKPTEKTFNISQLLEGIPDDAEMREMRLLAKKILASTERIESKLDEQFNDLLTKSNIDRNEVIQAIHEIGPQIANAVVQDVMSFLTQSIELLDDEIDEKLRDLYTNLKKSDDIEMKLKLSLPFIKLLGVDLEAKFDIKSWAKKMYKKYEFQFFRLLT